MRRGSDEGAIPFSHIGTHRLIEFGDLLTYKQQRDAKRRQVLDDLTRMSGEFGLYDMDIDPSDLIEPKPSG